MIHIARDGNQLGQFSESEVREGLLSGRFLPGDLSWKTGMSEWIPLSALGLSSSSGPALTATAGVFPWEQRSQTGLFKAAFETIKAIFTAPQTTFASLGKVDSIGSALTFFAVTAIPFAYIALIWNLLFQVMAAMTQPNGIAKALGVIIGGIIAVPVFALLGVFLVAGLYHLTLLILGGVRQGFAATFAVICYSYGAAWVFQILPFCGGLIAGICALVFTVIGLKKIHEAPTWKAVVTVLAPMVLCCACVAVCVFLGLSLMGDHLQEIFKQIEAQAQAQAASSGS
jgi:hypothetical protein